MDDSGAAVKPPPRRKYLLFGPREPSGKASSTDSSTDGTDEGKDKEEPKVPPVSFFALFRSVCLLYSTPALNASIRFATPGEISLDVIANDAAQDFYRRFE